MFLACDCGCDCGLAFASFAAATADCSMSGVATVLSQNAGGFAQDMFS